MRRIVAAFLLVICSSVCAPALTPSSHIVLFGPKGRTYYVSPKGSNANSGLDPARAWQNPAKVNGYKFNRGDRVLFQGGQTFTGDIILTAPVSPGPFTIGSYGSRKSDHQIRSVELHLGYERTEPHNQQYQLCWEWRYVEQRRRHRYSQYGIGKDCWSINFQGHRRWLR